MKLKLFTTARQVRAYQQQLPDGLSDKMMTIGDFFSKAIVVPGKKIIDEDLKKVFLHRALQSIDATKLGLSQEFVRFFKNADFVLDFFAELFKEGVSIEELSLEDTYAEYAEHLQLLDLLLQRYLALLEQEGFVDGKLIQAYVLNEAFLAQFEKIEMEVVGYLSRFERQILEKIDVPIELRFWVSRYNRGLMEKMFGERFADGEYLYDFGKRQVLRHLPLERKSSVEVAAFGDRIYQVHYALASVEEFAQRGCKPQNIAVILPDESFSEYLELFNNGNLNFAMGKPFIHAKIYQILDAIYRSEEDEVAKELAQEYLSEFQRSDLLEFIKKHASAKEMVVLEEELFKLSKLLPHIDEEHHLHFTLDRLRQLRFDDTEGGKVTVMGVLEARGMEFDGVIVLDFNEGVVPDVGSSDLFLNSVVRKRAGLPTRSDKEALQKHYYDRLLANAKFVRIAYVQNEELMPSRFLYELGLGEGKLQDEVYDRVLFSFSQDPQKRDFSGITFEKPATLTPTTMQTLLECPLQYYFANVLELKNEEADEEFIFGLAFHQAVEKVLKEGRPVDAKAYFEHIMSKLLQGRSVTERYEILSQRAEGIEWFCNEDFARLSDVVAVEGWAKPKKVGEFTLTAKYDRLDRKFVIDYKTGKAKDGDRLQALFYTLLFEQEPLFYYLKDKTIKTAQDFEVADAKKELEELLGELEFTTRYAQDQKVCQWCDYRFLCHRIIM